jgi:cytoplasmic iron level regulating protein YaaA (DUF328/UPF0246 family)
MNSRLSRLSERKLLVISCTSTKMNLPNAPALEVYDGPTFRTLRKHISPKVKVLIISAKYGIINSSSRISPYDMRMSKKRALELRDQVSRRLNEVLKQGTFREVFLELGRDYMNAVDIQPMIYSKINFTFDKGTIGIRLHNLKTWLEQE